MHVYIHSLLIYMCGMSCFLYFIVYNSVLIIVKGGYANPFVKKMFLRCPQKEKAPTYD